MKLGGGNAAGRASQAPELYLCALGKHPGWDDHIDDLGIETERLAGARRSLYTEAISGNIDAGAWEKLEDAQRLPGFAHQLVWSLQRAGKSEECLVGRLWSSRDGKGRTKYPMGVIAEGVGVSAAWMIRHVLPRLAALQQKCVAATTAAEVRAALDAARGELRATLAAAAPSEAASHASIAAGIADRADLGPAREGFYRVMYQAERELAPFRPAGDSRRSSKVVASKDVAARGQHERVPSADDEGAWSWLSLYSQIVADGVPILLLKPDGQKFTDVIIGDVAAPQLFCMRASEDGLPLASAVPYAIDDPFRRAVDAQVTAWKTGQAAPTQGKTPSVAMTPATKPAAAAAPSSSSGTSTSPQVKKPKWGLFGGIAIVVIGGVLAVVALSGNRKPKVDGDKIAMTSPSAGTESKASTPTTAVAPTTDGDAAAKQAEAAKLATAKAEADGIAAAKAETDRQLAQKAEADRLAAQKAETDRLAAEKAEADKLAAAKAEADRLALAKAEADRLAAEKASADKAAAEKAAAEKAAAEKAAAEKLALEKAAADAGAARTAASEEFSAIQALLATGWGLSETPPNSQPLASRLAAASALPTFAELMASPEGKALEAQMAALRQVGVSNDAGYLAGVVKQPAASGLAATMASWRKLATASAWPANGAQLQEAGAAVKATSALISGVNDAARAAALSGELQGIAAQVWARGFATVDRNDASAMSAAAGALQEMQIAAEHVPPSARFDLALSALKREVAAIAPGKDAEALAAEKVRVFLEAAVSIKGAGPGDAAISGAIEKLTAAMPSADDKGPRLNDIGPATAGWTLQGVDGRTVTYAPPAGSKIKQPLAFVAVDGPSGVTYLGKTEVSVHQFIGLVDGAGKWPVVLTMLRPYDPDGDSREGPRVWDWVVTNRAATSIKVAPVRPSDNLSNGWIARSTSMRKTPYYPPGLTVPPPNERHPMQQVSPAAAAYAAVLAGCRLPTVKEWQAGLALAGSGAAMPPAANVRDATWAKELEYIRTVPPTEKPQWPDAGICWPATSDRLKASRANASASTTSDDGSLWFTEVDAATGVGLALSHLVGNVAEFVLEDGAQGDVPADPAVIGQAVRRSGGLRVIGGSAMSAGSDFSTPVTPDPDEAEAGYSDVGFRFAFSAAGLGRGRPFLRETVAGLPFTTR